MFFLNVSMFIYSFTSYLYQNVILKFLKNFNFFFLWYIHVIILKWMTLPELSNVFYRYWGKGLPTWVVLEWYRFIKQWLILPRRQKGKNEINERGFEKLKYALFCCDYTQVCRLTRLSLFVLNLSQIIPFSKSEV